MVSSSATTVQQYINELESEKAKVIRYVRKLILENLPKGIKETMDWGMINYELPLSTYPKTYNKKPLSVMSLAAQKHHFALYLQILCAPFQFLKNRPRLNMSLPISLYPSPVC